MGAVCWLGAQTGGGGGAPSRLYICRARKTPTLPVPLPPHGKTPGGGSGGPAGTLAGGECSGVVAPAAPAPESPALSRRYQRSLWCLLPIHHVNRGSPWYDASWTTLRTKASVTALLPWGSQ